MAHLKMLLYELLLLLLLQVALIDAVHLCPLLGPSWPAPTGLSSDATVQAALKNITQTLQNASNAGKFSGASLSLEIFDTTSSDALLAYAYTAKEINTTLGVSKVDENTVFRIGSTSKMFPMFLLLIQSGFDTLQDPISKYIPEIKAAGADIQRNSTKRNNGIDYTNWNDITVGELASHLAGIARDCEYLNQFSDFQLS
jgi:CubicO group peptidase (beta-lactamase class C family)